MHAVHNPEIYTKNIRPVPDRETIQDALFPLLAVSHRAQEQGHGINFQAAMRKSGSEDALTDHGETP